MGSFTAKGGGMRVLVLEDNDQVAQLIHEWLDSEGHSCRCVKDSEELCALDDSEISSFQAVVLDCHQRGVFSLPTTLPWIYTRQDPSSRIVVMTGAGGSQTEQLVSQYYASILGKPFSRERFLGAIAPEQMRWPRT